MTPQTRPPNPGVVYVLSPHPDDACFSLGLAILAWRSAGLRVRIVTCFGRSGFERGRGGGHAGGRDAVDVDSVSSARAAEDRAFARSVGVPEPFDLARPDAPLRRGIEVRRAFDPRPFDTQDLREIETLGERFRDLPEPRALVAPLAIGDHLDHRIVREAALRASEPALAFYEDLPYAARRTERERTAAAAALTPSVGRSLEPLVVRRPRAAATKRRLARCYRSQVRWRDLWLLTRAARGYGGGERLWIDRRARFLSPPDPAPPPLRSS